MLTSLCVRLIRCVRASIKAYIYIYKNWSPPMFKTWLRPWSYMTRKKREKGQFLFDKNLWFWCHLSVVPERNKQNAEVWSIVLKWKPWSCQKSAKFHLMVQNVHLADFYNCHWNNTKLVENLQTYPLSVQTMFYALHIWFSMIHETSKFW